MPSPARWPPACSTICDDGEVQWSGFALYDRNPQTFVPNIFFAKPGDYRAATQKVFMGPAGTWIGLPVAK